MPYILEDLVVDRVDLVDEGANSAAFIEIFKRKGKKEPMNFSDVMGKLKPEHADIVQKHLDGITEELKKTREDLDAANADISKNAEALKEANEALAAANEELDVLKANSTVCSCDGSADENGTCSVCGKPKKNTSFDEAEVLKAMPEAMRNEFIKMREQKEAAEEQVRKAAEREAEAEAVAKAATLKALPVEQGVLVGILKNCDQSIIDVLSAAASAIEGTVLTEVGKSGKGNTDTDAWSKIEAEAEKVAERDSVTKQKAIGIVIKEKPELYKEYLNGGNK